jgi:hypothetical protein
LYHLRFAGAKRCGHTHKERNQNNYLKVGSLKNLSTISTNYTVVSVFMQEKCIFCMLDEKGEDQLCRTSMLKGKLFSMLQPETVVDLTLPLMYTITSFQTLSPLYNQHI